MIASVSQGSAAHNGTQDNFNVSVHSATLRNVVRNRAEQREMGKGVVVMKWQGQIDGSFPDDLAPVLDYYCASFPTTESGGLVSNIMNTVKGNLGLQVDLLDSQLADLSRGITYPV